MNNIFKITNLPYLERKTNDNDLKMEFFYHYNTHNMLMARQRPREFITQ